MRDLRVRKRESALRLDYIVAVCLALMVVLGHNHFLDAVTGAFLVLTAVLAYVSSFFILAIRWRSITWRRNHPHFSLMARRFNVSMDGAHLGLFIATLLMLYAVGWTVWIVVLGAPVAIMLTLKPRL